MTAPALVLPQISINGTDRKDLIAQQAAIVTALCQLERRMEAAAPHGRDYQHRPEEFERARIAWRARMMRVDALKDEITAHAMRIADLD